MTRDSFIFYSSYLEAAADMQPKDRLAFYDALIGYALEGKEPPVLDKIPRIAFKLCRPQIDANNLRYENGKRGGRPKKTDGFENEKPVVIKTEKPMVLKNDAEKKPNVNVNVNVNDNVNEKRESIERKVAVAPALPRFVKPTIQEVAAYAASLRYTGFNAERFYAYYESNGWRVGKNPMKSWKGAVVNWHQREQEQPSVRKPIDNIHSIGDFTYERTTI